MYDEGRGANNGHYIFTVDIAQLHRQWEISRTSLDEYLRLIETTPQQAPLAQDRILELLRDPRAEDEVLLARLSAASSAAIDTASPNSAVIARVLAMAYLENGMIENALEAALESEKTGGSDGKVLFALAREDRDRVPPPTAGEPREVFRHGVEGVRSVHRRSPQSARGPAGEARARRSPRRISRRAASRSVPVRSTRRRPPRRSRRSTG